jgi:hypothetical protein
LSVHHKNFCLEMREGEEERGREVSLSGGEKREEEK